MRQVRSRLVETALVALACGAAGCRSKSSPSPAESASAATVSPAPSSRRPKTAPLAEEQIEIPGGAFRAGSIPGSPGRQPELEPRLRTVELGPYRIDRLAYPNVPGKPPLTGVTREQAARLCGKRGARLCTELEWERACKGPDNDPYATGSGWDSTCSKEPGACASGFDVLGMGALSEWTASNVRGKGKYAGRAVLRGADPSTPSKERRCGRRRATGAETTGEHIGFRCCAGAPNAAVVKEPLDGQTYTKTTLTAERLEKLLSGHPRTRAIAHDLKFFREPDAAHTVVARGPGDRKGFLFTVAPLLWNPVAGAQYLVVAARSGKKTSFVVVYYVVGDDEYKLASSFIMEDEVGPVALAYNGYIRPRLHFSTCWGCPGETGKILYRDPDSAVILQP